MVSRHTPRTRARDIDRALVCGRLDTAYADGQLDFGEHRDRTARAMSAKTLGELADLVRDLQPPEDSGDLAAPPSGRRPGLRRAAAVTVAVAAAAAGAAVMLSDGDGPAPGPAAVREQPAAPVAVPDDGVDPIVGTPVRPLEPGGFEAVLAAVRDRFGNTVVYRLVLRPERAHIERALPDEPGRIATYTYAGGALRAQPVTVQRFPGYQDFDLGAVDAGAVTARIAEAPALVGLPGGTVSHVSFAHDGTPAVTIYVESGDGTRYVKILFDGGVLGVF
ncbi:DUF1707 domain-containing protein [Rhodococcus aetherivorans]|uniref:DUF1707 SHOCT-like domain-containing protein n=1 Tax=Rhodococcus aetherivorans TaxID=191292 RepID=UPI0026E9B377|nr:DUF1707 domain-containing protein [Rhodococcus aetherivorans]WKW98628.1 DUF1707 domain-containing protein [Rhodococcus aetherivorans]